ncbi:uncharacterized protein LOC126615450 [Malus sylvestris]|uniref:uncharacterized protein LOC126615450 n=1 Tax=Malus sylvestris TaxID=3752 RepID=UPI0021ACDB2E|nr:uncharacterized protein LOC126615450 [Malus sylvestris]
MTTSPKKERSSATKTRRRRSLRRELRRSLTPWSTPGPSGSIALPQSPPSPSRRIGAAPSARSTPSLLSRSSGVCDRTNLAIFWWWKNPRREEEDAQNSQKGSQGGGRSRS